MVELNWNVRNLQESSRCEDIVRDKPLQASSAWYQVVVALDSEDEV